MTNQNPASHEPEHETDLRSLSTNTLTPKPETLVSSIPPSSLIKSTTTLTPTTAGQLDDFGDRCPSPTSPAPPRLHTPSSPRPLSIYHRKSNHDRDRDRSEYTDRESTGETHMSMEGTPEDLVTIGKEERPSSPDDDDDDDDDDGMSNDVGETLTKFTLQRKLLYLNDNYDHLTGLNMALNPSSTSSSHNINAPHQSVIPPISSNLSSSSHTTDLRPSSRGGSNVSGNGGGQQSSSVTSTLVRNVSSRELDIDLKSSPMSEPVAGPSGMGPVQIYPLVNSNFFF